MLKAQKLESELLEEKMNKAWLDCEEQINNFKTRIQELEKISIEKNIENNKLKETVDTQSDQIQ